MPGRIGRYGFAALLAALVYGIVFSYFTILRHETFFSAAWDLGNFNQAFYTTLHNGKLFYYTADVFFSPSGSAFAIHTSPILFLLLPFYALSPLPETLLVLKSFGIGLAAIPLYFLGKHFLDSGRAGFAIALVYLSYAPLQGANWFDFQQSAFIPLFVLISYYFMVKKNWKLYFPTMALSLMIEEHVAIIIGILALYFISYKSNLKSLSKSLKELRMNESWASILTIISCVVYLFIAVSIKNSFSVDPVFAGVYKASGNFQILGSSDTLTIPVYAFLHPERAFQALTYDFVFKFFYVIFLFAPLLFIPLRNRFVLGIIVLLSPFLLSNYRPYYELGVHYPFYVIPIAFIATIYGLTRLGPSARVFTLRTMIVVVLLFAICVSPLSPISNVFVTQDFAHISPIELAIDQNKQSLNELISRIPPDSSVLTQNVIFPHVSSRINAYAIPFSNYGKPSEMETYVNQLINESEYVLLDMQFLSDIDQMILDKITKNHAFGPYALGRQSILFRKGYNGEPANIYYIDNRILFASRDFMIDASTASLLDDPTSGSGKVVFYPYGSSGNCIYGPYIYLLPGMYEATFTIKVGEHGSEWLGTVDITTDVGANLASFRDLYGFEMKTNEWMNFTVPLGLSAVRTGVEFRVYSRGIADVLVDRVLLKRVSETPTSNFNLKNLRLDNIQVSEGNITEEGFLIHNRGMIGQVFWYGPYWSYPPGNYSITFMLKTVPSPQQLNESVLTLSVSGRESNLVPPMVLNNRILYGQDFTGDQASNWHSFTSNFTVEKTLIEVEFRGLWPSPNYDIYLAYILIQTLN